MIGTTLEAFRLAHQTIGEIGVGVLMAAILGQYWARTYRIGQASDQGADQVDGTDTPAA